MYTITKGVVKMQLLEVLRAERSKDRKGGIYHQTQIRFAYNSNRIEGSRLTSEQTRYIYETHTLLPQSADEVIHTDDIIETINHFRAFDYLLQVAEQPLCEEHIKTFHALLKSGTSDERDVDFAVGDYKKLPNMIGESVYTAPPKEVARRMQALLVEYAGLTVTERELVDFHYKFEKIHPFQDGNGRVGRLVMFKECLYHGTVPFVIDADHKLYYYRGLAEYPREQGWLIDTCLVAQDSYRALMDYFGIDQSRTSLETLCADAKAKAANRNAGNAVEHHALDCTPERGNE